MTNVQQGEYDKAEEIALKTDFIQQNAHFMEGGSLYKLVRRKAPSNSPTNCLPQVIHCQTTLSLK
jgi:hypothetical protein